MVEPSDRFCAACGTLLRGADERRIVSVVFADLVGFTSMSEARDPEQVRALIDRCFERLVADITAYGGTIDKIIGDGIVALFGAPQAHEDDPERAVRAALRMQRTVAAISSDFPAPIQMRIGVNTGEVLVGALRAGGDYTAMGDTVNLASRLEAAASPGGILVGPSTYEATNGVILYESQGVMPVRGREAAVVVHRAVEELTPPGRRRRRERTAIVGREPELNLLVSAVDLAVSRQHAQHVMVLGDAGVGKSRLAEEVSLMAERDHGALVLEGHCLPYGETSPWFPLAEAIRSHIHLSAADPAERVEHRLEALVDRIVTDPDDRNTVRIGLRHLLGIDDPHGVGDRNRGREQIVDALHRFILAVTATRPMVLSLADVNWADEQLLEVLDRLLGLCVSTPMILITTNRWAADDERWRATPGRHSAVLVSLGPLDRCASAKLAASLLATEVDDRFVDELYDRSGGNPFFLEELTNLLSDSAVAAPALEATDSMDLRLPDTLRGLVSARLDGLSPLERGMVEDAAVVGRDGPVYALVRMAQARDDPHPELTFSRLVAKDFFETSSGGWNFRGDLVREVAYSTLTKAARAARHSGIALWLDANPAEGDARMRWASRLSYHWMSAARIVGELGPVEGTPDDVTARAIAALETFAEVAEDVGTNYSAGKAYARIIEFTDPGDADRLTALLGRAGVRLDLRELEGAAEDAHAALEQADAIGDPGSRAQALTLLSEVAVLLGDTATARERVDLAIEAWRDLGDDVGLAEALRQAGFISMREGDRVAARESFLHALELYRDRDDRTGEGWCLQNLAWLAFEQGDIVAAEEDLAEALARFTEVSDPTGISWVNGLLAFVRFYQGRTSEAERLALATVDDADRRGEPWSSGMMSVLLASVSLWAGRVEEAVGRASTAFEQLDQIDDDYGRIQALCVLARALQGRGRILETDEALGRAAAIADAMPGRPFVDFVTVVTMGALAERGHPEAVLERAGHLGPDVNEISAVDRQVAIALAELQLGVGDPRSRLDDLSAARPGADRSPNLSGARALAAASAGDVDGAVALADQVLSDPRATYADRRNAMIAAGLSEARIGRRAEAMDRFETLVFELDQTDSLVSQAIGRLARSAAYRALRLPEAEQLRSGADRRIADVGMEPAGWIRLFAAAVGGELAAPTGA